MSVTTIVLILLAVAVLGGAGAYGSRTWGPYYGGGISLGGVLLILLIAKLLNLI